MHGAVLVAELLLLGFALPLAYRFSPVFLPPLPVLWLVALGCYLAQRHDPAFLASFTFKPHLFRAQLAPILLTFAGIAVALTLATWWLAPKLLFSFPREQPRLWALVMVLYPVLSVYPQGIIYRAFLMHRYAALPLIASEGNSAQRLSLILISALAFGFLHIIFRNPLAVALTLAGGLLFAWRYQVTNSLLVSSFEHALYGCLLFTLGLGQYFYIGRVRLH